MKREQISERFYFTEDERWDILKKTDQKCAHCGRPIFAIKGLDKNTMTVDHFIPISKGGASSRSFNLIPLCKACNEEKADRIINPKGYLPYLKDEYRKPLQDYYESYVHSFKYLSEKNMLADDEFVVEVPYFPLNGIRKQTMKPAARLKYTVRKAQYCDLDKIYNYYVRYLKKYDALDSNETAKQNIIDWFEKGCMYYTEKNGEIANLTAFDIAECRGGGRNGYNGSVIEIWTFSYYCRQQMGNLLTKIIFYLPIKIMDECNVSTLPVMVSVLSNDRMYQHLAIFPEYFSRVIQTGNTSHGFNIIRKTDNGFDLCAPGCITSSQMKEMDDFMQNFQSKKSKGKAS